MYYLKAIALAVALSIGLIANVSAQTPPPPYGAPLTLEAENGPRLPSSHKGTSGHYRWWRCRPSYPGCAWRHSVGRWRVDRRWREDRRRGGRVRRQFRSGCAGRQRGRRGCEVSRRPADGKPFPQETSCRATFPTGQSFLARAPSRAASGWRTSRQRETSAGFLAC